MAETTPAANNKSISFGSKMEREMGWNNKGITRASSGEKPAGISNLKISKPSLRKRAKSAMKRGMISEKAAKKHLSEV
jgi:hypothetical protein